MRSDNKGSNFRPEGISMPNFNSIRCIISAVGLTKNSASFFYYNRLVEHPRIRGKICTAIIRSKIEHISWYKLPEID